MDQPGGQPGQTASRGLFVTIAHVYTRAMMALGCGLLAATVIIMGVEVFFRYVLNDSIIWAEEMSRYLLIWMTFLFLGIAYQRGELITLSMVLRRVPKAVHVIFTLVAYGASLATLGIIVWFGFAFAEVNSIQTLPAFDFIWASIAGPDEEANISAWWVYASVPVGAGLLALHMLIGGVVRIRRILADLPVFVEDMEQEPIGEGTR